ncbi:MAG: hypothetical protein ACD_75C02538G0002 [uncultured bacterium]|uniref:Uncharacterized protein n=1 Tax=Citrifermentans bemidjiense (strain ATCC BAA-1014 / DSM 16622 / JCM 12645 / Bem) TaxID=404380 RepID=B5EET7_CITBB|nr:hypothetical protein [Citrifermentans bemidjiense]ACH37833.1 hypothetical protein Gbem_0810 [Citrifermentans bemidjiense Bem]EKD33926.1 MAG: hypothetical protein ACD_75C02538G0002 [uncultured bacterium]
MKALATKLAVFTAVTLISALPVLAGENGMGMSSGDNYQKDECLLVAQTCRDSVDTIQQRIDRLSKEIGKGTSVYNGDELKRLNSQLQDATRTLEMLISNGA